jgi:hypothetical protein
MRAGTIISVWTSTTAQFTDISTADIGSTSPITFLISMSSPNIQLSAVITSGTWVIKTAITIL